MKPAGTRWVLIALAIGVLAVGYVWLGQVTATTETGRSGSVPQATASGPTGEGGASMQPAAAQASSVPAPGPGQQKVVIERLGMV